MMLTQSTEPAVAPCVLDAWEQGIADYPICARALGMLLLSRPELVHQITSFQAAEQCLAQTLENSEVDDDVSPFDTLIWLCALAQLHAIAGRDQEADACYARAVESIGRGNLPADALSALAALLDHVFARSGHEGPARRVRQHLRRQILMSRNDKGDLITLRECAFECFETADYAEAERIYRYLLVHNFEVAGTYCHLVRVYLMTGRDSQADQAAELAWENRADSPPYIIARIHFLRALLATLAGRDASPHLAAVIEFMSKPASQLGWLMAPVLDALRPRLSSESHELFTRLANTLSGRTA